MTDQMTSHTLQQKEPGSEESEKINPIQENKESKLVNCEKENQRNEHNKGVGNGFTNVAGVIWQRIGIQARRRN